MNKMDIMRKAREQITKINNEWFILINYYFNI